MITIIYSTHKDELYNSNFKKHLLQSVGLDNVQILEYVNKNQYSLSEVYNKGISESKNDIIVCCHNDIKLEKGWGKKLLDDFNNNPEYGIIGKAGSCYFPKSGVYWEKLHQTMVGQVYHHPPNQKKFLSKYSPKIPFLTDVVTIDGVFISFNKTKIKHFFDESYGKFHFYDHGFTIPNYLDNVKIGVTSSFDLTHESVGQPNAEFYESKKMFLNKWGDNLPLDLKPQKIYVSNIERKKFKKFKKVAIIIPTKGNVSLIEECVKSFHEKCDKNVFNFFIADTGSSNEEKKQMKLFFSNYDNIKLIEYDYYNFAKINNDVVKNYVDDNYEFILFCNNDIKILNDVITGMLSIYEKHKNAGVVGCRLHFEDNTIQHDGILMFKSKDDEINLTHKNFKNYYNYNKDIHETLGSTAALCMVRKNSFLKVGMFNEDYITCFEDVEMNLRIYLLGFKNYINHNCVSYHYESKTRQNDGSKLEKEKIDISKLRNFIKENIKKIENLIVSI
jgi:GT2 family glycosyltransferase